jgi:hypothetical protein
MNSTRTKLESDYAVRFLATAGCVAGSAISARLLILGEAGGQSVGALFIAVICGIIGWKSGVLLCGRWRDLKQLDVLQEHGPYSRREFIAPDDAVNQVGGGAPGRNMWGSP